MKVTSVAVFKSSHSLSQVHFKRKHYMNIRNGKPKPRRLFAVIVILAATKGSSK